MRLITFITILLFASCEPFLTFAQSQLCDFVPITNISQLPDSTVMGVCNGTIHQPGNQRTERMSFTILLQKLQAMGVKTTAVDTIYLNGTNDSLIYLINTRRHALKISTGGGTTTDTLKAGFGISGSNFNGSANVTWKADTARKSGLPTYFYVDSLAAGSSGWPLTGATGTNPAINFIGTTDTATVVIKRNNITYVTISNEFDVYDSLNDKLIQATYDQIGGGIYVNLGDFTGSHNFTNIGINDKNKTINTNDSAFNNIGKFSNSDTIFAPTIQLSGGSPAIGKVWTGTDALGNASWQTPSGGVTSFSYTNSHGLRGSVSNPTATPALTLTPITQAQGNNTDSVATTAYSDSLTKLKFNTVTATSTTITDLKGTLIYDMDCTSNVDTLKLPAAATVSGNFFLTVRKKDSSVNKVVVKPNGSETINGQTSMVILFQNTSAVIYSNGSNYYRQ